MYDKGQIRRLFFSKEEIKNAHGEVVPKAALAVERALIRLYQLQTEDEKNSSDTKHNNAQGFSQSTVKGGTYWAKIVLESANPEGKRLYGMGVEKARQYVLPHCGQLANIANGTLAVS